LDESIDRILTNVRLTGWQEKCFGANAIEWLKIGKRNVMMSMGAAMRMSGCF
jgi:hypothetical protein